MEIVTTRSEFRRVLDAHRTAGRSVGLVPTMGALHEGHLSLVRHARARCDVTAMTIFVNPLQFAPTEDLSLYPRPIERDLELAAAAGVDVVFTPTEAEMYPRPMVTTVHVAELTASMEGAARPTHFDGVTTVVTKLFNLAGPCHAFFGEKDYQQVAVVSRMAADLEQPVVVVPCPIVREPDGLAMSSRNVYLDPAQRAAAVVLSRALADTAELIAEGELSALGAVTAMAAFISSEPLAELDYAALVDAETLEPLEFLESGMSVRLLVCARFGTTRLLDNMGVVVP